MKKVYRKLLLFASSTVFLALAPLVILYAVGYRTTFPAIDPIPTGVALIESIPSRADVYVDGTYIGRTPQAVNNLQVGQFRLRIASAGYTSWEKTLHVRPGRATEARAIRLFPEEINPALFYENVSQFSLSPNRQIAAIVDTSRELNFIDDRKRAIRPSQPLPFVPTALLWSPSSTEVLLQRNTTAFGIAAVDRRRPFVPLALPANIREVVWHPRLPQHLLILTSAGALIDIDTVNGTRRTLLSNVNAFATSTRTLYAITGDQHTLTAIDFQGNPETIPFTPPAVPLAHIRVTPSDDIALITAEQEVYVYTEDTGLVDTRLRSSSAAWSPDGKMLLLTPDQFSLHVYNVSDKTAVLAPGQAHLIVRLSRSVAHAQWFAGGRHMIYQVEDEVTITEIDTRDHPISYVADTTNTGNALLAVGRDGESLFYVKRAGSRQHLYLTPLLVE